MPKIHGNYCGPNWSAGKAQTSVVSDVEAIDEFDQTCLEHDASYAMGEDLIDADTKFYHDNIGQGPLRSAAAIVVGGQGIARRISTGLSELVGPTGRTKNTNAGRKAKMPTKGEYNDIMEYEIVDKHYNAPRPRFKGNLPGIEKAYPLPKEKARQSKFLREAKEAGVRIGRKVTGEANRRAAYEEKLQGLIKSGRKAGTKIISELERGGKNMTRGNKVNPTNGQHSKRGTSSGKGIVPVNSLQTFIKSTPSTVKKASRHGETLSGTLFIGSLSTATKVEASLDDLALQLLVPLNPANFGSTMLSNTAKFYEQYRFKRLRVHYITNSATTTAGTVLISHQADVLNEIPSRGSTSNADLYTSLFSRENTLMGPVWDNSFVDVPPTTFGGWKFTDSKFGHTMNEIYDGYILAYSTLETGIPGRVMIEYECEFKSRANEISFNVPRSIGVVCTFTMTAKTAGNIASGTLVPTASSQRIYAVYFDVAISTFGTGSTFTDNFELYAEQYHIGSGQPIFVKEYADGNPSRMYPTLEAAIGQTAHLTVSPTTTTDTVLIGLGYLVINDLMELSG